MISHVVYVKKREEFEKTGIGAFDISFIPRLIGKHQLILHNGHVPLFRNNQIILSVSKDIPTEKLDYEFSLEGKDLSIVRVNQPVTLSLSVTENNVPVDVNPSKLSVKIFGNGKTSLPEISHTGTGSYTVVFQSSIPGIYSASIIYDGTKVLKRRIDYFEVASPFHSRVSELKTSIPANQPASMLLQSLDTGANLIGAGGDAWSVNIKQIGHIDETSKGGSFPLQIIDEGNGNYNVQYTLPIPGSYQFDISVNGKPIRKSPFKVTAT